MNKIVDDKLKFNEEKHEYKVKGKKLTSVTTFIEKFFNEFDVEAISKKVAIKRLKEEGITKDTSGLDFKDYLDEAVKSVLAEWQESRDVGTEVHQQIEDWYNSRKEPTHIKAKMGVNWSILSELNGYDEYPEAKIYSEELGLAGTIDLLQIDDGDQYTKPRVWIVDWKTNKKLSNNNPWQATKGVVSHLHDCHIVKYSLQMSLYAYILERDYGMIVEGLSLVHLKEDGYKEIKCDYLKETIKNMLKVKRK